MVPTLLVFLLIGGGGLVLIDRSYRDQVMQERTNQATATSHGIDNWLIARISTIVLLSQTPVARNGRIPDIVAFLKSQQRRLSFVFKRMYYILPDGYYWDTDGRSGYGVPKNFLEEFAQPGRLFYYDAPETHTPLFGPGVLIGVPIVVDGKLKAVLASTISLSTFGRMVGDFAGEGFGSFAIVNPKGEIIADSSQSAVGEKELTRFGRVFTMTQRYHNDLVFVSVLRTDWTLLLFVPLSRAFAPVREMNTLMLVFLLALAALATLVSHLISGAVARPVRLLTEGVHGLMEGNYRQRVNVQTKDELSELAEAFNRLADRMARMRADDQFLFLGHIAARMAHEMRRPLHIVQLAAQTLRSKASSEDKYLSLISQEIENADRFIREILNFVRPEQLNLSRYPLQSLVLKTVRKFELVAEEHHIVLSHEVDEELPPFYFDVLRMDEVVSNLLQNAIEAAQSAPEDERKVEVRVGKEDERGVILTVTDTGPGFDPHTLERAMDPYFTTKANGTGIGLSLSYRILTAHGAQLLLDNTPDHHGRVQVVFPP